MELASNLWGLLGSVYGLLGALFLTAHILLPNRFIHPPILTIECREDGCKWKARFRDYSKSDKLSRKLVERMKNKHKAHFLKVHPDKEWIYG